MNSAFERGLQTGSVGVIEDMGKSPEATRAIRTGLHDQAQAAEILIAAKSCG
jgi:hypothetical protein